MAGPDDSSVRLQDQGPLAAADVRVLMDAIAPLVDARVAAGAPHGRLGPAALRPDGAGARLVDVPESEESRVHSAPEVRDGAAPTARSEVYALATTTYTLLTGHPPNPYGFATVRRDRPDLGPGVDGVLLQATARTPDLRFASATAFAEALAEALDEPVAPSTIPVRDPVTRPAPAPQAPLAAAAEAPSAAPRSRPRFEVPEAALPIVFLLLVVLVAAGFMALFLSGS